MATYDVIRQAVEQGINFIITHEPTWFNGGDQTDWCEHDSIYLAKRDYLEEHNITIWRLHDHLHMGSSVDYIYEGLIEKLGWREYLRKDEPQAWIYEIPETTLRELAMRFKKIFNMDTIQIIGSPEMSVKRVGILVGGGSLGLGVEVMPMQVMERDRLDLMVVGDITEWTICAYLNDAYQMGFNKGMLTLGHERSEEAGMEYIQKWIEEQYPFPIEKVNRASAYKHQKGC